MQADGRLARARPALHGYPLIERGADDLVLLGLDGGHNVQHLAGAGPLEFGQQRVATAQPGTRRIEVTGPGAEEIVGHGDHRPPVDHDLSPPGEAEGVSRPGPVEGHGNRGPPVDDHRIAPRVLHVASTDVPRLTLLAVDATEQQRSGALGEHVDPTLQRGPVVEVGVAGTLDVPQ